LSLASENASRFRPSPIVLVVVLVLEVPDGKRREWGPGLS
jgi:hypothetical protein